MRSLLRLLSGLLLIACLAAGFAVAAQNPSQVPLWIGTHLAPRPVGQWLVLAFAAGGLFGLLVGWAGRRRAAPIKGKG